VCNVIPAGPLATVGTAFAKDTKDAKNADTVGPKVGKPLQEAQSLMQSRKYTEALAKIDEADAVPKKTPYEQYMIERMRGAAAAAAGQLDTAAKAFDAVIKSGKISQPEQLQIMQAMADAYYRAKDYTKTQQWAERYEKAGGTDPSVSLLVAQTYYLKGNYSAAAKDMEQITQAEEKGGKAPTEEQLQFLASCYLKQNDTGAYVGALEKLVTYYPKKDYWADLLARVQRKPGFSERLSLDVYRLMRITGNLKDAGDYMEMAQLALQAGYPKEAQEVIDKGYETKVLGTGTQAAREQRLKALADKQAAEDKKTLNVAVPTKDADAMVNTGYNLVINGEDEKGLSLMKKGIAKGGLKHPGDATLHLGEAYLLAGHKDQAIRMFRSAQGNDGVQDLARLFVLAAKSGK
jgi:tetratricopeptide (TPR) repeat protein